VGNKECQAITRKSASNLALAFVLLPKTKREGMSALYAFCREVDDVTDEDSAPLEARRTRLAAWREDVRKACQNGEPEFAVNRELQRYIREYQLPLELFDELIKGCETDLEKQRHENFDQLEEYCYRVASVVGLLSIRVFGYVNPRCEEYAMHLGKALQLTNILRDVRVDADRGRIYLPLTELKHFGVTEEEILRHQYSERYEKLAASVAQRAREHYGEARKNLPSEDRRAMVAAELMGSVYWRLLLRLEATRFNVFGVNLVRLGKLHKLALIFRSWLRFAFNVNSSDYGPA